jgi:hypothetical protein
MRRIGLGIYCDDLDFTNKMNHGIKYEYFIRILFIIYDTTKL